LGFRAFASFFKSCAVAASGTVAGGVTAIAATHHHLQGREQISQGSHRGRFAGTSVTQRQNAAHFGVDGDNLDGKFHLVLADDSGEREGYGHGVILSNAHLTAHERRR
jgi:hypothetical protein